MIKQIFSPFHDLLAEFDFSFLNKKSFKFQN